MKRLLTLALLASTALASIAPPSFAGTFGVFYWGRCCCNGCGVHPYNAFTPVCCGGCGVADLGCSGGGCGYIANYGPKCGLFGCGLFGCTKCAWKNDCDEGPGAFGTDGCNKTPFIACPQKKCKRPGCCVPAYVCPPMAQPCASPGPDCSCSAQYGCPGYAYGNYQGYPTAQAGAYQGYPTAPAVVNYQGYRAQPMVQPVSYQYGYQGYQAYPMGYAPMNAGYPMGYGSQGYGY